MDQHVIEMSGLSFRYDGVTVLEGVDLKVDPTDFAAVVGPNGGGKTTLLKLMLGLLNPSSGQVRVFGLPPRQARVRIGYMPQHAQMDLSFPVNVYDVVLMGRLGLKGGGHRQAVRRALDQVEMLPLAGRPFAALSGGQRQRVLIARALAGQPDLLLLDEPTANVDQVVERGLFDLLSELNCRIPVLVVSHDLGFVSPYVKSVICVNRKVVMHPTSEVTGQVIADIYGQPVRMVRHDHQHDHVCQL